MFLRSCALAISELFRRVSIMLVRIMRATFPDYLRVVAGRSGVCGRVWRPVKATRDVGYRNVRLLARQHHSQKPGAVVRDLFD